jgi:assimilatory nitrate reductase catalytic subunit
MRDYLARLPGTDAPGVLLGRTPSDVPDPGPTLCSCFGVGLNTILEAIQTQDLISVEAIGEALQAGANCGSCRPELADLLSAARTKEAAE